MDKLTRGKEIFLFGSIISYHILHSTSVHVNESFDSLHISTFDLKRPTTSQYNQIFHPLGFSVINLWLSLSMTVITLIAFVSFYHCITILLAQFSRLMPIHTCSKNQLFNFLCPSASHYLSSRNPRLKMAGEIKNNTPSNEN